MSDFNKWGPNKGPDKYEAARKAIRGNLPTLTPECFVNGPDCDCQGRYKRNEPNQPCKHLPSSVDGTGEN